MTFDREYTFEDYLNCELLDVHRWSDYPEVIAVRNAIMAELGFKGTKKEVNHVTVVLLNLYRTYCLDPEMWVMYSRDRNDYNYGKRYNKLFIKYENIVKTVDGLLQLGYIEHAIGFQDQKTKKAFESRMKATTKLIALIEKDHGVTFNMVGQYGADELIVLRNADGESIDFVDTKETKRMASVLRSYNELLCKSYIDIHFDEDDIKDKIEERNKKKDTKTGKPKDYRLTINLSNKRVRRIFNKSTFNKGGRFYGGWWQNMPSTLRKHIIIDTDYTIEIDFSGLHIYMLYALKGINFADLRKEPYIYAKDNDTKNYRPILKVLLLAAVNSGSEDECVKAVRYEINMNRSAFPDEIPDLKEAYKMFKEYHSDIADLFCSKKGLKLQRWDSDIAEDVVRTMTEHGIPILVVHDSFICSKKEQHFLEEVMRTVYLIHAARLGIADGAINNFNDTSIEMKTTDVTESQPENRKEETILTDYLGRIDSSQARRFTNYLLSKKPNTNIVIKVLNEDITEVGYNIEIPDFNKYDGWL